MLGSARTDAAANGRWLILLVLVIARAAISFQFQSIPALSPLLVDSLRIDYALLGTLVGLYMLPGVIFSLPGGLLGQRFGDKQIAVLGLSLMVLGGLWVGLSGTYLSASLGRIVSGVGAVLLNIVLAMMVTDWFAGREIVTAMAFFVSSWPVGIGLGLLLLPILATAASVMLALLATALVSALALVLVLALYRSPVSFVATPATFRIALSGHEWSASIFAGTGLGALERRLHCCARVWPKLPGRGWNDAKHCRCNHKRGDLGHPGFVTARWLLGRSHEVA